MAEVSKFKNSVTGEEQEIKDAVAREEISELNETLTERLGDIKFMTGTLNPLSSVNITANVCLFLFGYSGNNSGVYFCTRNGELEQLTNYGNNSFSVEINNTSMTFNNLHGSATYRYMIIYY